ncbi:hypothetical protein [Nitriliruptor alkaliphilus]|uniref:NmrA family NAD(P)-binding protein n=1 Tax=Nitriliruptor alkaliphilus TaxID=427918 RepID=UPI0006989DBA|nr:hypothetical protein [Nitriliruptor alkaliphilus]
MTTNPPSSHTDDLVAVTGATGKTGRRVLAQLAARGTAARPLSRRSSTPFDLEDETTWADALRGATSLYLVVPFPLADPVGTFGRLATRAAELGVRRQVLLSARGIGQPGMELFTAIESAVTEVGTATTRLRPTWFAQNFTEDVFEPAIRRGVLRLPAGDLRDPFIDAGDIAEVAAATLTSDAFEGQAIELSGPRVLSFRDAATIIAASGGVPVTYEEVDADIYRRELIADGYREEDAEVILGVLDLLRDGRSAHLASGVQDVLGRPPRDFAAYVTDAAATGAWRRSAAA